MKNLLDSIRNMYQTEATMMRDDGKMVHNCAKHVEHAEYGRGNCIAEEHADPDAAGNIAWYDVMFEHGLVRAVPTTDLKILQSESHMHANRKSKKVAEEIGGIPDKPTAGANAPANIDPNQAIKKKAMSDAMAAANKTAAVAGAQDKITKLGVTKEQVDQLDELSPAQEDVDETVYHHNAIEIDLQLSEADKNYDAYFKAQMKKHGINHPGELDTPEKKKAFFNKVDAGFKAKNEEVFLEAWMSSALQDVMAAHKKAGNKISDEKSTTKDGKPHHSFVVTTPEGKRTRHVYHGSTKKLETMSPAARSKEARETGEDQDDK